MAINRGNGARNLSNENKHKTILKDRLLHPAKELTTTRVVKHSENVIDIASYRLGLRNGTRSNDGHLKVRMIIEDTAHNFIRSSNAYQHAAAALKIP